MKRSNKRKRIESVPVVVRFLPEDIAFLDSRAHREGSTRSETLRRIVRKLMYQELAERGA